MGRTRFPGLFLLVLLQLLLVPAALSRTPVTTSDVPDKIFGHDEQKLDMSRLSPGTFFFSCSMRIFSFLHFFLSFFLAFLAFAQRPCIGLRLATLPRV